jgi:hypothetical protein
MKVGCIQKIVVAVGYMGMGLFFAVPLYRIWIGQPYNMVAVGVLLGIAIGFGMFATYELRVYEREVNEKSKDLTSRILKIHCPKCGDDLIELVSPIDDFVVNSYKGLIYCKSCDFEEAKDRFEKEYPNYE